MIHHETISARAADPEGEAGNFDVIEDSDGFNVVEGSSYLSEHGTLRAAVAEAKREAAAFDRRARRAAMKARHRADLGARNLERYGLRLAAWNGATRPRTFAVFEAGRSPSTGEAVEWRREFASKRERDDKARALLAAAVDRAFAA